ncbi:MAG: hypothetical protein ABEH77_07090, partial [Halobacteriaceae archaeon]
HSQSSQRVIQELAEAFNSWYGHRHNGTQKANPPGYRKHGDQHPRSTVTFKQAGFKHDATYGRVRLSKGANLKDGGRYAHDYVLCDYEVIGPPGTAVENVQQVRTVHEHGEWRLHFVCRVEIEVSETPGDRTAGVDLGICNVAAVSFGDETLLYPGNTLREDLHYFLRDEYDTDGEDGPSKKALWARRAISVSVTNTSAPHPSLTQTESYPRRSANSPHSPALRRRGRCACSSVIGSFRPTAGSLIGVPTYPRRTPVGSGRRPRVGGHRSPPSVTP